MNFNFTTVMAVVETAALVAALYFMTGVIREKKHTPAHKALQKKASICVIVFLLLNVIRNYIL